MRCLGALQCRGRHHAEGTEPKGGHRAECTGVGNICLDILILDSIIDNWLINYNVVSCFSLWRKMLHHYTKSEEAFC